MIVIGLTGSIAMGKSTVAAMFADMGIPVFDADACVRDMIAHDPKVRQKLNHTFKTTDRQKLGAIVFNNASQRQKLEAILHPRVAAARKKFLITHKKRGKDMAVLDIPLLFETGLDQKVNTTIVVSAPPDVQKTRAMNRPGMTEAKFNVILSSQMPDAEKQARADHVILTHIGLPHTQRAVRRIVNALRKKD